MAKVILDQFAHLKQPTGNYLFQVDGLTRQLKELKDETTKLLFDIETRAHSSRSLFNKASIPFMDIKALHQRYSKGFKLLNGLIIDLSSRQKELNQHYKIYSNAIAQMEAVHG
jgi:hypothetical protein